MALTTGETAEFWGSSSFEGSSTILKRGEVAAVEDELELSWSSLLTSRVSSNDREARACYACLASTTFPLPVSAYYCYIAKPIDISESPEQSEIFRFVWPLAPLSGY